MYSLLISTFSGSTVLPTPLLPSRQKAARRLRSTQSSTEIALYDDACCLGKNTENGLVVAHFGQQVLVEPPDRHRLFRCLLRPNDDPLAVGDRVLWCPGITVESPGRIASLLPRSSLLTRPHRQAHAKPVAANVDQLLVVMAALPEPSCRLIDQFLIAAQACSLTAILILNKMDLLDAAQRNLLDVYEQLGYHCVFTQANQSVLNALPLLLQHTSSILLGPSGVGKSSLINALIPDAAQQIRAVSERSGLGQHTTTTARLFHLNGEALLIDAPGIREFSLDLYSKNQIIEGYKEIAPLIGHCRFRNCQHLQEPGCALKEALANGQIHPSRFKNFMEFSAHATPLF